MPNENEFEQGTKFMVCGVVKRKWVADSGKYGTMAIETPGKGQYAEIVNVRLFKDGPMDAVKSLVPGTIVKVLGVIGTEAIKDKKGDPIMVDGYKRYEDVLTVKSMKIDEESAKNAGAVPANDGHGDDDIPAGW